MKNHVCSCMDSMIPISSEPVRPEMEVEVMTLGQKTIRKRILPLGMAVLMCFCSLHFDTTLTYAKEQEVQPDFQVSGASIRFVEENQKIDGIRFAVAVREEVFASLSDREKTNYHLLVMPTLLVDGRLEKEEIYSYKNGASNVTTKAVDVQIDWSNAKKEDGYLKTHVYLNQIGASFYTTGLTARMYYQDSEGNLQYSQGLERSYAGVADAALNDEGGSLYTEEQRNALLGVKYEKTGTWDFENGMLTTDGLERTEENHAIHPMILERNETITSSVFEITTTFQIGVSDESVYAGQPDGTDTAMKGFLFGYDDETKSHLMLDFRYRSNVTGKNGTKVGIPGWYPYLRMNNGTNGSWSSTVVGKGSPLETGIYDFKISVNNEGAVTQVIVACRKQGDTEYQTIISTEDNLDWSSARQKIVGKKVGFLSTLENMTVMFASDIQIQNADIEGTEAGFEKTDTECTTEDVQVTLEEGTRYTNPIPDENQPYRSGSVEAQKLAGKTTTIEDISMAGDPYILRYNGKFYLYVSTNDWYCSYRCWESLDLVHYTFLGEYDLLDKNGNRTENDDATNQGYDLECPWAPEVHYWNGQFYMYTSPHASGHVVLQSTTGEPWGDYKVVTEGFDSGIDGSFFIDDDETKWFIRAYRYTDDNGTSIANPAAIQASSMTKLNTTWLDSLLKKDNHVLLSKAGITGRQVEGPFVFKRNGIYYMIATGEDVGYPGYRLNYAYNNTNSVTGTDNWSLEKEPNLLISTEGTYQSYGHGAVTTGPDLDSYWFVYHMARSSNLTYRMNGISRIEFSGTRMSVMGQDQETLEPSAPDFYTSYFVALSDVDWEGKTSGVIAREAGYRSYTDERTKAGEGLHEVSGSGTTQLLSGRKKNDGTVELIQTGSRFTAEYNFKNVATDGTFKCLFGGGYVTINGKKVQLYKGTAQLAEATMSENWDWSAYHDIIVASGDGRITVTVDGCQKIDEQVTGFGNGAIGYEGATGIQIGGAVFSNQAFGSSDKEVAKNVEGIFYASNYYEAKDGESASKMSGNSKLYTVTDAEEPETYVSSYDGQIHRYYLYKDATALQLAEGDRAVYKIDAAETGTYSFAALFAATSNGSIIKIQIDDEKPTCYIVQTNVETSGFEKRVIDSLYLEKGLHTITVKTVEGIFTAIEYELNKVSTASVRYTDTLTTLNGGEYFTETQLTAWSVKDNATYAASGKRNLARFGNADMTDYHVSVDLKTTATKETDVSAGIILRMTNPSLSDKWENYTKVSQVYGSSMGYYICLDKDGVSLYRFDYNEIPAGQYKTSLNADTYYTLEAECVGETITVWLDGKQILTYTDTYVFCRGAVGMYSNEAESSYRNLAITPAGGKSTTDYIGMSDTAYTCVNGTFRKTQNGVKAYGTDSILLENTVNRKGTDRYAVNTIYTVVADKSQSIKGIVLNYNEKDGSYLVMDYRYVNGAYRLYVRHYDGTDWSSDVWNCDVELEAGVEYQFNISVVNHTDNVTVSIDYKKGTDGFKQVSRTLPIAMKGRKAGYICTIANNLEFARLVDTHLAEIGIAWPDNWSDALGTSQTP